ncbi:MAG: tetratricopeptide repeat protein [Pyrinomonadaceae bacterium]
MRSVAFCRGRQIDQAIIEFRAAIKTASASRRYTIALGAVLRQKGDLEGARAAFQDAARISKIKSQREAAILATATNTGIERLKEGNLDAAIERFEAAIKLMLTMLRLTSS